MKIQITKTQWYDKETGFTYYAGAHDLPEDIAIRAAAEGATDNELALAKAKEAGVVAAASKARSKQTKAELLDAIVALEKELEEAQDNDADNGRIKELEAEVTQLKTELEEARAELTAAQANIETQAAQAADLIAAFNATTGPDVDDVTSLTEMATALSSAGSSEKE